MLRLALPLLLLAPLTFVRAQPPRREVTVDASFLGGAVGCAAPRGRFLLGIQVGLPGDFLARMLAGGEHFTRAGDELFELAHGVPLAPLTGRLVF